MARPPGTAHPLLLDAAERLLLRHRYRRVTVEDLAREAGIGKGSVYLHFDSKEEVALAVVNRWSARGFDRLPTPAAPGVPPHSPAPPPPGAARSPPPGARGARPLRSAGQRPRKPA